MTNQIHRAALVLLLILSTVDGKKTRRIKLTTPEDSSPQPSVVSYSTFGFNDVGSYDGFVPSSPDYATYLSSVNHQDSSKRLYAPAFPSSLETSGFGNNFESQPQDGQTSGNDNNPEPSMLQYNSASYFNTENMDSTDDQGQNASPEEKYRRIVDEESNSPVYGTKLGAIRNKHKFFNHYNESVASDAYSSGPSNQGVSKYQNFKESETTHESNPTSYGESASSHQNIYTYAPTYPPTEADEVVKPTINNTYSFNFPKVIDFTKYKQYYPTEIENKYPTATFQPVTNKQNENKQSNNYESHSSSFNYPSPTFKNTYKVTEEDVEKEDSKQTSYTHHDYSNNFATYNNPKSGVKGVKPYFEYKDKIKYSPWASSSQNNSYKNWRNPGKGYEYSTDFSNMSFKYDTSTAKKPFSSHSDELTPASSNVIDLSNYKFPETDYSSFKKIPGVKAHYDDEYSSLQSKYKELFKSDDYINQFKNVYSNTPTTSSLWGNIYKGPEFTSHKHPSLNSFGDEITSDVVHIPKKLYSHKYSPNKYNENKPSELSFQNKYRPHKANKPSNDWTKDVSLTRFKSEEDLLGLRTHDTSHPSYLPSYKPFNDVSDEFDYKKLVEKWRQSYLKSKYKEAFRDFETYASEAKPVHVPIPKPYAVPVPVLKPYPVPVPHIRPVFHHTRPSLDETEEATDEDDDYLPRPENYRTSKKVPHTKRPRGTRYRPRRPLRATYQGRNRRRWPARNPSTRPSEYQHSPFRSTFDEQEFERSDYYLHCKRTGSC